MTSHLSAQAPAPVASDLSAKAFGEVGAVVRQLHDAGVTVRGFEDTGIHTPDSVFPNNWVSTHAGSHIAIYPVATASRLRERR